MAQSLTDNMIGKLAFDIFTIEDGQEEKVESVSEADAFEYLHGYDNIVPGLEKALAGKGVGDTFDVVVPPEEAYGDYDDDLLEEVPYEDFNFDEEAVKLEVDMEVEMLTEEGDIVEGTIIELKPEAVVVDLNPPLAGMTLRYVGTVVSIREATEEEREWGYPESLLDELFGDEDFDEDDEDE